ncbi:MAG TPA: hypothetical protein VI299_18580 [Polyangiales bacterium]
MWSRALWLLPWLLACGGSDTTTGRPIALANAVRAAPEIAGPFATETGWTVQLSKAAVSIGALYYFDGEPAFVRREAPTRWLASALGLGIARAHPGHYFAGIAVGQMTTPSFADLLADTTMLPAGDGISGAFRSARLQLATAEREPALSMLGGGVAIAEGIARNGTREVFFRVRASFDDVARSVSQGAVDGCVFEEADVEGDGVVTMTVVPHVWFNLVDFTDVAAGSTVAPTELTAGSTAQIAFSLGVAQLSAYRFAFAPL